MKDVPKPGPIDALSARPVDVGEEHRRVFDRRVDRALDEDFAGDRRHGAELCS